MAIAAEDQINSEFKQNGFTFSRAVTMQSNLAITGNLTVSGSKSGGTTNVVSGSGATVALTAAQSGSIVLMDRAAGITFTLPAPVPGLSYDFITTVSVTSNGYKVITDAGTTFLIGGVTGIDTDSSNAVAAYTADGSTIISLNMTAAGTNAKGGLQGTQASFRCVTATLWEVTGIVLGAGTVTTPFSTT